MPPSIDTRKEPERRESAPLLLTIAEAALVLNDSERHVADLTRSGALPSTRVGAFVRIPRRGLYEYIVAQQRGGQGLRPYVTDEDIVDLVASALGAA